RPLTVVSLDSTMGRLKNRYNGHMSFEQNIEVRERMLRDGIADEKTRFICHHFSHNGIILYDELSEMMKPHGFDVAYDGLTVTL
ncbi:MAG: carbon-phosphorus lyase, partial [Clostridia bacterium]|nr:carbon-phosphorus lyase [Clostridia bacterium]